MVAQTFSRGQSEQLLTPTLEQLSKSDPDQILNLPVLSFLPPTKFILMVCHTLTVCRMPENGTGPQEAPLPHFSALHGVQRSQGAGHPQEDRGLSAEAPAVGERGA